MVVHISSINLPIVKAALEASEDQLAIALMQAAELEATLRCLLPEDHPELWGLGTAWTLVCGQKFTILCASLLAEQKTSANPNS